MFWKCASFMCLYELSSNTHTIVIFLPDVSLTSDFIAGFCGETEEDHSQSLELIERVGYSFCFCFPYSMREVCIIYIAFKIPFLFL